MSWKADLLQELGDVKKTLEVKQTQIEKGMDKLESDKSNRDEDRKKIMISELKNLLRVLGDVDKKISKDIKAEAFDTLRQISKLKTESDQLEDSVQSNDLAAGDDMVASLNSLKSSVKQLQEVPRLEVAKSATDMVAVGQALTKGKESSRINYESRIKYELVLGGKLKTLPF